MSERLFILIEVEDEGPTTWNPSINCYRPIPEEDRWPGENIYLRPQWVRIKKGEL